MWDYVKENVDYPYYMIRDRFAGAEGTSLRSVKRGQGQVIEHNGTKVAAYRDLAGAVTLRSATCTHMGCIVAWNAAERDVGLSRATARDSDRMARSSRARRDYHSHPSGDMPVEPRRPRHSDVNAVVGGYLRDLAMAQATQAKMFGYKRAAAAILRLERALTDLSDAAGMLPKIAGIGPGSARVIDEVLATGSSPTVERAIDASGRRADIERRRTLRGHFLSRAEVLHILRDSTFSGLSLEDYRGDFQMHSEWSDGNATLAAISRACVTRGYSHAAVTDHSYGLKIAGGMSMQEAADQRRAIDDVNANIPGDFRLLHGIEANIGSDGRLDLSEEEAGRFEIVLAAPHSMLRKTHDQTQLLVSAVQHPHVRVRAPAGAHHWVTGGCGGTVGRGVCRGCGTRRRRGNRRRSGPTDLDYTLAAEALDAGCLFALDSDAHTTGQLAYAETAIAHARLAGIPCDRIVNCWPLDRVLAWLSHPVRECRRPSRRRAETTIATLPASAAEPVEVTTVSMLSDVEDTR